MREEGHYTLKRVNKLPKRGNSNLLYFIKNNIDILYRWRSTGVYETIESSVTSNGSSNVTYNPVSKTLSITDSNQNTDNIILDIPSDLSDLNNSGTDPFVSQTDLPNYSLNYNTSTERIELLKNGTVESSFPSNLISEIDPAFQSSEASNFVTGDKSKLDSAIQSSNIISTIDGELGSTNWQSGGGGILTGTQIVSEIDTELGDVFWREQKNTTKVVLTVDTPIQNTNRGNFEFNSFSIENSSIPLATFTGETLTIQSNSNRLQIEAYIQTRGELDMEGSYYFSESSESNLDLGETLQDSVSVTGLYGNNSKNTNAVVIVPPNINIDLYLVHDTSIGNQVIKTGSIITITEI